MEVGRTDAPPIRRRVFDKRLEAFLPNISGEAFGAEINSAIIKVSFFWCNIYIEPILGMIAFV